MKKYYTADRETGTFIEGFNSYKEAKTAIADYLILDELESPETYDPDFYVIVDEDHCIVEG